MSHLLLIAVIVILLLNLLFALVSAARKPIADRWLLIVLLSGTSGAGLIMVLAIFFDVTGTAVGPLDRFADVGILFIALTALTAAVRVTASKRGQTSQATEEPSS